MAPLAAIVARVLSAKLWIQLHGIEAWEPYSRFHARSLRKADLLTAVSRYTRRRALAWLALEPHKLRVLPNTVDKRFTPGPKRGDLVDRHGLKGRKVLLTVSRLVADERYKGHDRVIRALPAVLRSQPNVVYVIAGDGDDRRRLEGLAETEGVSSAVCFIGQIAGSELLDYYRLADVFVMPSTGEGFGIVFLEASAVGLPVIGGNRDGSVDALAEGELGRLVDPDDLTNLGNAIMTAFERQRETGSEVALPHRFALENFRKHVDDLVRSLH
jgi:phosphatidylinositol alpha-1,6-mannosyltransferase